jgi:hypothetical protein
MASAKTFVPMLNSLCKRITRYIDKHHETLHTNLGDTRIALVDAITAACDAFTSSVVVPPEGP